MNENEPANPPVEKEKLFRTNKKFTDTVDIPEPFKLKGIRDYFKFLIGPGIIAMGLGLGTGEIVAAPFLVVKNGPNILWIALFSILIQTYTAIIGSKYTILTGEPVQVGMNRLFMNKKAWTPIWVLVGIPSVVIPYYPALLGMTFVALIIKDVPTVEANLTLWVIMGIIALLITLLPLILGKKIMKTLGLMFFIVHFIIIIPAIIIITIITVEPITLWNVTKGLFMFGSVPSDPDWQALGAVAGFAGLAASAGLSISTYYRDSEWGMAKRMGHIGGAGGEKIEFKTMGYMPKDDEVNHKRAKKWYRYIMAELFPIFFLGSIVTMIFPVALYEQFVPAEAATDQIFGFTAVLAQNMPAFIPWWLILVIMAGIFYVDGSGVIDGAVRNYTNMLWNAYPKLQSSKLLKKDVRRLYYGLLALLTIIWIAVIAFGVAPVEQVQLAGSLANIGGIIFCLGTIGVNYILLPSRYRMSIFELILIILAILFYIFFLIMYFVG
ncbi:MAG: Nramp family divalent metal transporter [Candidatus Lokiarchaeota archaeon]|nr:Nramp family divalent metal transporter [Candidatus Lokiarchaeota archaeon]